MALRLLFSLIIALFLAGVSPGQQLSPEPAQPALHVQTELVIVPFEVRRGSRSVFDLKPSDVVLLEDGAPCVHELRGAVVPSFTGVYGDVC